MSAIAPIETTTEAIGRVFNNSDTEYSEMFRGKKITIPAREFIELEYYEAVHFVGQFVAPIKNEDGSYVRCKPLSLQKIENANVNTPKSLFISHADGKTFTSERELAAHLKSIEGKYEIVEDEKLDKAIAIQNSNQVVMDKILTALDTLTSRLEKLETRKKPGRKAKSDTDGNHHARETGNE